MDFKVKCTARHKRECLFTVGKIYEVKNGKLRDNEGHIFNAWALPHNGDADFEALRKWFESYYDFELVEQTTKYKVGDKVRVRSDLRNGYGCYKMEHPKNDGWVAIGSMIEMRGKVATITGYSEMDDCYYVEGTGNLRWTDEMFEGLAVDYKIGDKVIVECSNIEEITTYAGKTGVIVGICTDYDYEYPYHVEFEPGLIIWCKVKCLATENDTNNVDNKKVEDNAMKVNKFKVGDKFVGNDPNRYVYTRLGWKGVVTAVYKNGDIAVKGCGNADYNQEFTHLEAEYFDLISSHEQKIVITHDGKTTTATMYCEDGTKKVATARCAPEDDFEFRVGAEIAMARLVDKLVFAKFNVIRVVFREGERAYSYKTRMQTAKVGMEIVVPVGRNNKELNATVVDIIPGDEYDGDYAMSAMKEIDVVEVPKYYNGKVVCIKTAYPWWTVGKIYEVKDGRIRDDDGCLYPNVGNERYVDADDVRHAGNLNNTKHNPKNEFIPIVE